MSGHLIRHVATSREGSRFAVAEFERKVYVWSSRTRKPIAQFETTLDFGGNRLAVTTDGEAVIVGAYNRYGIAAYDSRSGAELWRRKELKKVQTICVSHDDCHLYCSFARRACHVLDRRSGDTTTIWRQVNNAWESAYDPVLLFEKRDLVLHNAGRDLAPIQRATFAVLDTAFAPGRVCVTESGGPVRCFDTSDAQEVWRFDPPNGSHVLPLSYAERLNMFVGIDWPYKRGGLKRLVCFEKETGHAEVLAKIDAFPPLAFCCKGSRLITPDGQFWDVATGSLMGSFAFPKE